MKAEYTDFLRPSLGSWTVSVLLHPAKYMGSRTSVDAQVPLKNGVTFVYNLHNPTHPPMYCKSSLDTFNTPNNVNAMQIVIILYCLGNNDNKKDCTCSVQVQLQSVYLHNQHQQQCNFLFSKYLWSTVHWIHRCGTWGYIGYWPV